MKNTTLLFTAEHGGNKIPKQHNHLFVGFSTLLKTHRGLDIGTWGLAERFNSINFIDVKLFRTDVSRLLVDVNRSLWRRTLFSEVTKPLSIDEKEKILAEYYYTYRNPIYDFVENEIARGQKIIHIAIHSFTPKLNGKVRNTDVGLLYNPERRNEKQFCKELKREIIQNAYRWKVRYNYPYRGKPDGLPAHFRKLYADYQYLGIEYEVNQKYASKQNQFPAQVQNYLLETLSNTVKFFNWQ